MSMKKKLTVVVTAVTLVALIAIGATLAWFTDSKEVTNVVTMGNIKITLEAPIFSEENENNTITGVLPNQPIDKDPTITNVGNNDAYIRAKINYDGLSAEQAAQVEALLNIDEEAWVKGADGYYYYQEILAAGAEPIQLFTVLTIPNWGNEVKDLSFTVGITAEAVQSDYFTPDGDGVINGWGALNPAA